MKLQVIAIFAAVICGMVVPVCGQTKTPERRSNQGASQRIERNETRTCPATTGNVVNQQTPEQHEKREKTLPQSYLARLVMPETLPQLILCGVGLAGIIVGICTLIAIRKQTEATRESADAARDSVKLQEAQMRQWVDLTNWRGGNTLVNGDIERRWLETYFDIINPSGNPLTLSGISVTVKGEPSNHTFQHMLTPNSKYSSSFIIPLTSEEAHGFLAEGKPLVFAIVGEIAFIDFLKHEEVQPFRFLAIYKYGASVKIDYQWM